MENRSFEILLGAGISLLVLGAFFSLAILQIGGVMLLIPTARIVFVKLRQRRIELVDTILLLFFISGAIAILISPESRRSLPVLMRHLILLTLIGVSFYFRTRERRELKHLALIITMGAFLASAAGLFHAAQGIVARTYGFYGGYYTLASLLAFAIPISAGLMLSRSANQIFLGIALVLQFAALWFTYTRSAFLAVIVSIGFGSLFFIYRLKFRLNKQDVIPVAVPVLLTILLIVMMFTSGSSRINPVSAISQEDSSKADMTSGRSEIISDAIRIERNNFNAGKWEKLVLGNGLRSRVLLVDSPFRSWESDYLEALMNQGIVGFALMIFLYTLFFFRIKKALQRPAGESYPLFWGFALSGIGYAVMSFFTLQVTSLSGVALFVILFAALDWITQNQTQTKI